METYTESISGADLTGASQTISKMTDVQDGRVGDYDLAYRKTLDNVSDTRLERSLLRSDKKSPSNSPENRYFLNHLQRQASRKAAAMEEAARRGDPQDVALAGMEIIGVLREMWKLRNLRSDEWGMVLNYLQAALAAEVLEDFDATRSQAIRSIIERHLGPATNQDDVDSCLSLLEEVGLDPLKVMVAYRE